MSARTFKDVVVWQKAHSWVLGIYRFTAHFPDRELYGLAAQLRRASVSVPANFCEGFRRNGTADKLRFYNMAQGSLEECRYYLILARDLGYGDVKILVTDLEEVSRLLEAYARALKSRRNF